MKKNIFFYSFLIFFLSVFFMPAEANTVTLAERNIDQWNIQRTAENLVFEINIIKNHSYIAPSPAPLNLPPGGRFVKVLLYKNIKELFISCDEDFTLKNSMIKLCLQSNHLLSLKVLPGTGSKNRRLGIIKNINKSEEVMEIKCTGEKPLKIITSDGTVKNFRGKLLVFINSDKKLTVINQLTINEYLGGVIPNEMPAFFPMEALKAQAIVARTYTMKHLGTHKKDGADLCSTVHCHVYGGMDSETEKTNNAVKETIHQLVFYNDKLADTVYHSTCGGMTAYIENSWELPSQDYLISVPDQFQPQKPQFNTEEEFQSFINSPPSCYCQESGKFRWEAVYTEEELEKLYNKSIPVTLKDAKIKPGKLEDVTIEKRGADGRVLTLLIKCSSGEYRIEKDKIRWLTSGGKIAKGGLSSTLFYIYKPDDGTYHFMGGGWGHGIGLCQFGAKGMAEKGFSAEEIIKHYYPGSVIKAPLWY